MITTNTTSPSTTPHLTHTHTLFSLTLVRRPILIRVFGFYRSTSFFTAIFCLRSSCRRKRKCSQFTYKFLLLFVSFHSTLCRSLLSSYRTVKCIEPVATVSLPAILTAVGAHWKTSKFPPVLSHPFSSNFYFLTENLFTL